jgi:LysM repeat protein
MRLHHIIVSLLIATVAVSCTTAPDSLPVSYPTYDPFVPVGGAAPLVASDSSPDALPTGTAGPTPSLVPLSVTIPTHNPDAPLVTPTPDRPRSLPTARVASDGYIVQAGDTLGSIAQAYDVSVQDLADANGLTNESVLSIGQSLDVPAASPGAIGPSFKIIPDSELVYGPASALFDIDAFVQSENGYLTYYTQDLNGETLTGAQVIRRVAQNYSVNPRLLLALLEYRSRWVTTNEPIGSLDYPLGYVEPNHDGLYRQLSWAANELNRGFYLWRVNAVPRWVLGDGSIAAIDPTINAGTAAVQGLFAIMDDRASWETDVTAFGLFQTYFFLFSSPFDLALGPVVPVNLSASLDWPFRSGSQWAFTAGLGADSGCVGRVGLRSSDGWLRHEPSGLRPLRMASSSSPRMAVIQDLDGDAYEQTGWNMLHAHGRRGSGAARHLCHYR